MTSHKHGVAGVDWCYCTPGELEQARKDAAAIARVRALHEKGWFGDEFPLCRVCNVDWPCATVAALGGDPG
jgi:hypothetical protein